ncbi:MAG: type II secretion system ATPase GspE [Leptospirales bacterium]
MDALGRAAHLLGLPSTAEGSDRREFLQHIKSQNPDDLWRGWASSRGTPFLTEYPVDRIMPEMVMATPIGFAKTYLLFPVYKDVTGTRPVIEVLIGHPRAFWALSSLATLLAEKGHIPEARESFLSLRMMTANSLLNLINSAYERHSQHQTSDVLSRMEPATEESIDLLSLQESVDLLDARDEAPMIRLANSLLGQAIRQKASDIHVEPFDKELLVRYRVDGVLFNVLSIPPRIQSGLISRFKLMANLNIAEKRLPQDGRIRIRTAGRDVDIRVSTIPIRHGERVVLRILEQGTLLLPLSEIGFDKNDLETLSSLIRLTNGIILVTGPTGAGKTTTLYAILNTINSPDKNIITIEDPVEYQLKGIGQIQVNPRIDLTFASGLRSILRQDPDVILIGEIRDLETAEIAIQASLTGHLVFSTLHTNDASSAITRLVDMGIEPFLISTSLKAILAQRLVRKICAVCREPYTPEDNELIRLGVSPKDLPGGTLYRGRGCPSCLNTGYKGRQGIYELLVLDETIGHMIDERAQVSEIRHQARSRGMFTLLEDGKRKVLAGITTTEEVLRVALSEVTLDS